MTRRSALLSLCLTAWACSDSTTPSTTHAPAALLVVSGDSQFAAAGTELSAPLIARVLDSSKTPVKGQLVNFRVTAGGGSVFAGAAISNDSGVVRERWTLGTRMADSQRVEARAVDNGTGAPIVFAVYRATALAGPADSIIKVAGDSQLSALGAPQPESLVVRVADQYGNPVAFDSVSWTTASGSLSTSKGFTDVAGRATALWTLDSTRTADTAIATLIGRPLTVRFVATGAFTFVALAAGHAHTCGLAQDGSAYCWGLNLLGELGTGDTLTSAAPRKVLGSQRFTSLAAGEETTCAVTTTHQAFCWGKNASGELGAGTPALKSTQPVLVAGGHAFAALSVGAGHACGVTVDSLAFCWGDNYAGDLGNGDTVQSNAPVGVAGGLHFVAVSAGTSHSCGIATGGAAYCWGDNLSGEVGSDTSYTSTRVPVPVVGALAFEHIAAGWSYTCGTTVAGAGYCWGSSAFGALGNGQAGPTGDSIPPGSIVGGHSFDSISVGTAHLCAVASDHITYCWGDNEFAELGTGASGARFNSSPLPLAFPIQFRNITAAKGEFTCGLDVHDIAYCWGSNGWGQIGDGIPRDGAGPVVTQPTRVVNPQ